MRAPRPLLYSRLLRSQTQGAFSHAPLASHTHFIIVIPHYEERVSQWQVFTSAFEAKQQDK